MRTQFRYRLLAVVLLLTSMLATSFAPLRSAPAAEASTPRTVFVHLFEWKWTDIAKECETFLGPKGYNAVQVSPPNEHVVASGHPWWQRYQPVSYTIQSRSGTRAQFIDMVQRCKAVGVSIYVDAVINHMAGVGSGTGSAGTNFTKYSYPGLYSDWDFSSCRTNISNYNDHWHVQNCELVGLADLKTSSSYVRGKIANYLIDMVNIGVAGFRIDAAKHIHTDDIKALVAQVNAAVEPDPYIYQEVIDAGGEAVKKTEYYQNGDVLEFVYGQKLGEKFFNTNGQNISQLRTFGESWGFAPSDLAGVFVDNHDKQRGHGGGGDYVTYKNGSLYDLANVFMLAWPFGYPQVMSSYDFHDGDQGPPSDASGNTLSVHNADGSVNCFGTQWKCEHRWRPIANMVAFRNYTNGAFSVSNWWDNGANQIAFSRGNLGFVAINREGNTLSRTFQTGLSAGIYCNVTKGDFNNGSCTGPTVTVNADGTATVSVAPWEALAIHGGAKLSAPTTVNVTFNVNATTTWGQNVYVVGNVSALGNWNTANAVLLGSTAYPTWSKTIAIPANTAVEYKYIKKDGSGNVVWESGTNRTFTTPASGSTTRNESWR